MSLANKILCVLGCIALSSCSKKEAAEEAPKKEEAKPAPEAAKVAPEEKPVEDKAEEAVATHFDGNGFRVPLPKGYTAAPPEALKGFSEKLQQTIDGALTKPRAAPDHFMTSFVFTKVPSSDVNPETACEETSKEMAAAVGAEAQPPKQVEFPFGKTCQFEMGDDKQHAIQTIVYVDKAFWTLTCNFDPRDEASRTECNEVLTGFAAK